MWCKWNQQAATSRIIVASECAGQAPICQNVTISDYLFIFYFFWVLLSWLVVFFSSWFCPDPVCKSNLSQYQFCTRVSHTQTSHRRDMHSPPRISLTRATEIHRGPQNDMNPLHKNTKEHMWKGHGRTALCDWSENKQICCLMLERY